MIPRQAAEARALAEASRALWQARTTRMDADEDAWRLVRPTAPPYGRADDRAEETLLLTDCAVQADAAIEIAATVDLLVEVAAAPGEPEGRAQAIEDLCRAWLEELTLAHGATGQADLRHTISFSNILFGWTTALTLFAPEALVDADGTYRPTACPFRLLPVDPRTVFPDTYDGPPSVLIHQYAASRTRLEQYFGRRALARIGLPAARGSADTIEVTAFYTDTHWALLVGQQWLRPPQPHGYGFNPLLVVTTGGMPFRGPRPAGDPLRRDRARGGAPSPIEDWAEYAGVSFLRAIRPVVEDMQKIATMQRRLLERAAAPPAGYLTVDGRKVDLDLPLEPGDSYDGRVGDQYVEHPPDARALQYSMQLRTLGQAAIQMAGLNAQLLGGGPAAAGFDRFLLTTTGLRHLRPYLRDQARFWQLVLRRFLRLAIQFLPLTVPITFVAPNREQGLTSLNQIRPLDLMGADVTLRVRFGEPGPQDKIAMGNLGMGLMRAGVVSPQYVLGELLKEPNPQKVLQEREDWEVRNHPAIRLMRGLARMAQTDPDPLSRALAGRLLQQELQRFSVLEQQAAAPPGQPGVTAPPEPNQQLPPEALPPALGANAGLAPNAAALGPEQVGAAPQAVPEAL